MIDLQELRHLTKQVLEVVYASTYRLPYTIRLLAREALLALRVKDPNAMDEELTTIVARTVVVPFILPALVYVPPFTSCHPLTDSSAPEVFGIQSESGPIGPLQRRNLNCIANLINHVAAQDFTSTNVDHFVRTPLREYIRSEGAMFHDWIMDVASVEPLETYFGADELLENTVEAKPIMITRSEIYGSLSVLLKNVGVLVSSLLLIY